MNSNEVNNAFKKQIIKNKHEIDYAIETQDVAIIQKLIFELIATYIELIPRIKDDLMIYHTDVMTLSGYKIDLETIYKQVEHYARNNTVVELPQMRSKIFNRGSEIESSQPRYGKRQGLDLSNAFQVLYTETQNNGHLTRTQIDEIMDKLKALETISKSNDPRPTKWYHAGEIIQWLGSTSVDIGVKFMPIIMRIFEE